MTETTVTPERPLVVEEGDVKPGFIGQNIPRKEDKRLVQGEGVFFDDVKRHEMGYVHFVRSPYAHARDQVGRRLEGARAGRRLRDAHGRRGRDPHGSLLRALDAAGREHQGLRARGRPRAPRRRPGRCRRRTHTRTGARRGRARRSRVRAAAARPRRRGVAEGRGRAARGRGSNTVWSGVFDWGDFDAALADADHVVRIERLHFDRFSSTPLECSGCLVEFNRGTGQWTIHGNHQMPGVGAIWMAPALRVGIDKLRFVSQDIGGGFGNKITLHPQYTACCLLARKLNRPVQWTEWRTDQHTANTHGNERTFLDVTVPVKADGTMLGLLGPRDRRLRRVPALRAARVHHLGAGHAGLLPLAQHPRRLHAGLHEQVAGGAQPRLLADAASLADRADRRHRRRRARPRPDRGAQEELRQARGVPLRDAERLHLRLGRLRALPRHRARPDRLRLARGEAPRRRVARQAASASASAPRSTRGRTTSASR